MSKRGFLACFLGTYLALSWIAKKKNLMQLLLVA